MGDRYKNFLHRTIDGYNGRTHRVKMDSADIRKALNVTSPLHPKLETCGHIGEAFVYIVPANSRGKRKHHRTFTKCPVCNKEFTCGNIHQHLRTMHPEF